MNGIFFQGDLRKTFLAYVLKEIHVDKIYDPFFIGKKDLVVVDCGANIGMTSLYFSQYASKVVSVEPTDAHFQCLSKMVEFNELKNVTPVKLAVGNRNGTQEFHHSKNSTMNSLSPLVNDTGEKEIVETITLEDLFDQHGINQVDFLKIDVEGTEMDLICSESFARVADRIKALSVEYHDWSGRNPGQLVQTLEKHGFTVSTMPTVADVYLAIKV